MKEFVTFFIQVLVFYCLPAVITLFSAVQNKSDTIAKFAFIPMINIITAVISLGDIIYRFLT